MTNKPLCVCCAKNIATVHTNNYNIFCKKCADILRPRPLNYYYNNTDLTEVKR